ncbi:MAG: DUF4190 domain-containing protein [Oligosphaeraceae bacterium]|nr:DUF4190 domain-containing protein [Oligosphaeraceae bacterium]
MNITVQCPHCKTVLHSDDSYCGKAVQCSQCSQSFIVGQGTPAAVPPPVAPTASLSQPAGTYDAAGQNYYPRQTCGKATAALVCSIIGLLCCQVGSILGIVLGFLAKGEIRNSNGRLEGDTMATVGIVLGFLGLVWGVLFFLFGFASTFAEVLESL